jgi:hypothetical protein
MMRHVRTASCLLVALFAADAGAQTVYSGRALFTSLSSGLQTVGFDGILPAGTGVLNAGSSLTTGGLTFTAAGGATPTSLFVIGPSSSTFASYDLASGPVLSAQSSGSLPTFTVSLPGGTTSFGFDYGAAPGLSATFELFLGSTLLNTRTITGRSDRSEWSFMGVISPTPFTSVTVTVNQNITSFDNFSYGPVAASTVPEPVTGMLVAGGLLVLGGVARRRRLA